MMTSRPVPAYPGYLADPFLLALHGGFLAYGSSNPEGAARGSVSALSSPDLRAWSDAGTVMTLDPAIGMDVWAPEVIASGGSFWMHYSAGHGIDGHHLRVARADRSTGPFADLGVDLTPDERFAIDPHAFRDNDGTWYLFYARDVLDTDRPGTHLAVAPMAPSLDRLTGPAMPVLEPNADWQIYARDRPMYGRRFDWHTLEGPTVFRRDGTYYLFFSGGSWEGPGYGVSYATAPHPLGPWTHASTRPIVLSRESTGLIGPGHNSVLRLANGEMVTAFHAWNADMTKRQMHVRYLVWADGVPSVDHTRDVVVVPGAASSNRS